MTDFNFELNCFRGKAYTFIVDTFENVISSEENNTHLLRFNTIIHYGGGNFANGLGISDGEFALFKDNKVIDNLVTFSTDVLCDVAEIMSDGMYRKLEISSLN